MEQEQPSSRLIELEPRLLVLFLFIAIPFILIGCLFILGFVRSEMNQTAGDNMHGAAADTARYLESYVLHTLTNVSVLATTPALQQKVASSNRNYTKDPEEIRAQLIERDAEWTRARGVTTLAFDVVGDPVSDFLRRASSFNTAYKEILVTDRLGALVAATNITTDYYQADEDWWRRTFGDGNLGAVYVSNVAFDQSAGANVLEFAVPVREELADGVTDVSGILKVLVEATDLSTVVGAVRRGETGHALLVDAENGTVIVGTDASDVMRREYGAMPQLQEALARAGPPSSDGTRTAKSGSRVFRPCRSRVPLPSCAGSSSSKSRSPRPTLRPGPPPFTW